MDLSIQTSKITGMSDNMIWGGVFAENGFFISLEVKSTDENSAIQRGRQVLDLLLTKFTNYKERNLLIVKNLISEIRNDQTIVCCTIGLLNGQILYLASLGSSVVLIQRQGKIGKLLSANETSSGNLQAGDVLIFCCEDINQILSNEKKIQILQIHNPQETEEILAPILLDNEKLKGCAILVIIVGTEKDDRSDDKSDFKQISNPKINLSKFSKLKPAIQDKFSKLMTKFSQIWQVKSEDSPNDSTETRSKKTLLTVSIVLIALLFVSIFFNISHNNQTKKSQRLSQTLDLITQQYDEAVSLIDLNAIRARELLAASKISLSPFLSEFSKNSAEYKNIKQWLDKISTQEIAAYKIFKFTAVPLFFDINLIKKDGIGKSISSYKDIKVILDTTNQTVYMLNTKSKQAEIIAGSEVVKDASVISVHGKSSFLLNADGVVKIENDSKSAKTVIKKDDSWGEIKAFTVFGGNIYLLDVKKNTIWKYIATDFGFSQKTNYLNPDVRADLSQMNDITIDGSVWLISSSDIIKFTRGLAEPFSFKGISDTIQNISSFSTHDDDKNIYLFDKNLARILVFDKEGNYQSQYSWDELKNADSIVSSEEEKKIFILIGSKIYAIDIK